MQNKNQSCCDFHFIIDRQLKKQLLSQRIFRNNESFSGIVVKILKLMHPRLEKEHFFGRERLSQYQLVSPDLTVERQNVHVYLPLDLYRRLKLIHQDLNFYSIAQFIRWILRFFLKLLAAHGSNFKQKLTALLALWQNQITAASLPQTIIRQLSSFRTRKHGNLHLLSLYDSNFSPLVVLKC